ncbi:MAG: acetamidase/formamidase family protein, partial [Actinobacteria bacterium]|nr:acetamidase/formamidase family protein [Actinomycetota bacterium]
HYFRFDDARTAAEFADGVAIPIRPLVGVLAAEPAGDDAVSAITAGPTGGNLVLRDLGAGSHLFLPVAKSGARIWLGDIHAAQGDGVVDQTGIETAAELLEVRYDLRPQVGLSGPLLETELSWTLIGFADNLDDALVASLRDLIAWLPAATGITAAEAYALASMAVSFRVTQYAHQTGSAYDTIPPKAVHAVVDKSLFSPAQRERVDRWLRPGARP